MLWIGAQICADKITRSQLAGMWVYTHRVLYSPYNEENYK